jgi:DNA gyrase/topoisomerase IV subunit B
MIKTKSIEQKFKKLSEVEHCLARPGRYIGSISPHTSLEWIPTDGETKPRMVQREVTYNPGFLKLFDEVISNSADEAKRPGSKLDIIRVEVDPEAGSIEVYDNGGIPVVKHKEYDQYVPEMIFELRAGSNFDDDDEATLTGQNGEGAALTCIFSTRFRVETSDGKNRFLMTFTDNSQGGRDPKVSKATDPKGFTRITYHPDFEKLGMETIDQDNYDMLYARVVQVAATNTNIKVYWNGTRIMTRTFKDYIELFVGADGEYAYDETEAFKVGVAKSESGFQHTAFVNTTHTKIGGTHIHYIVNQIVDGLRAHIEKKVKVQVKPADIRNHLHLFVDATIVNPRYSSQTKDELITEPSAYGRGWSCPDKLIQRLLKTSIIQSVLDWVEAKKLAEEMKTLKAVSKDLGKADPRKIEKFSDASERHQRRKCILFLSEGDSASKSIQGGRGDNPYIGSFPLKGKPANVREKDVIKVLGLNREKKGKDGKAEPNEIQKILTIIGLKIGVPVKSLDDLRFGKLAVASDADVDGFHICGLLMNMIDHFWPELYDLGFVHILRTPVIVVTLRDKSQLEFFTERDYKAWEAKDGLKIKGWSMKYYKGLSSWSTKQFSAFLGNLDKYLFRVDMVDSTDKEAIDLAFNSQRADDRKKWLETPAEDFDSYIVQEA